MTPSRRSFLMGAAALSAAVATPEMVRAAAAVDSGAGVLFVVKNYTGDVLNFEMAAELGYDGVEVMVWTDPESGYIRRHVSPRTDLPADLVRIELPPGAAVRFRIAEPEGGRA